MPKEEGGSKNLRIWKWNKFSSHFSQDFFSPIHISKLLYWLVILGKTSKRLNTQSAEQSEPRGQEGGNCPPIKILAGIEAKTSLSTCHGLKSSQYKKPAPNGLSEFEILQTTWKNKTKSIKMLGFFMKESESDVLCVIFSCHLHDFKF